MATTRCPSCGATVYLIEAECPRCHWSPTRGWRLRLGRFGRGWHRRDAAVVGVGPAAASTRTPGGPGQGGEAARGGDGDRGADPGAPPRPAPAPRCVGDTPPLAVLPEDPIKVMHCRVLFLRLTQMIGLGRVVVEREIRSRPGRVAPPGGLDREAAPDITRPALAPDSARPPGLT